MSYPISRIETQTLATAAGASVSFRMVEVLGEEFDMGSEDEDAFGDEKPIHKVSVPTFWMGEFPITQELCVTVMGENPSYFPGMKRPVEQVSWLDITERFLPALNKLSGRDYRLPSESEWEYAARGGIYHSPYKYAGSNRLKDVGWYDENSHSETKVVGLKQSNALGLYDMSGNVYEWCADHWHDNYQGAPIDGSAWIEKDDAGQDRVLRGGSWNAVPRYCRVSFRTGDDPSSADYDIGFRLVVSSWQ
ncbi:MAG: formylglycine-generating enzyme family protein [Saprospiraceae bacterium]|nr:formylglycine-generating enzyme family protein [Saprospiraceae bacterium]